MKLAILHSRDVMKNTNAGYDPKLSEVRWVISNVQKMSN